MPALNVLDDYDRCFVEFPESNPTYCFVDVTVKPNISNVVWNTIAAFNKKNEKLFHHDRLQRGICIKRCLQQFKNVDENVQTKWYQPLDFYPNSPYFKYNKSEVFKNIEKYQAKYGQIINQCVNVELKTKYELMAYSSVEYCDTPYMFGYGHDYGIDHWDCLFVCVVIIIFVLTVMSSVYDYYRKPQQLDFTNKQHYMHQPTDKKTQMFLSFSVYRNFFRLKEPKFMGAGINQRNAKRNIDVNELIVISAFRFVLTFCVLVGHTILLMFSFPTANPVYFEQNIQSLATQFFIGGVMIVQCFFAISGFLLSWKLLEYLDKGNEPKFVYLWKGIISRWLRLTPVYAFKILLHSTWLLKLQDGPIWRRVTESERSNCRKNWWTNLLYINNYISLNNPCVQEAWSLGCDFQLFIISLFALVVAIKYPRTKLWIVGIGFIFAFGPQIAVNYVYQFPPIIRVSLEDFKYAFMFSDSFKISYVPGHMNVGGYFYGVIGGWIWFNIRKENIDLSKQYTWFKWFVRVVLPLGFLFVFSNSIFLIYDFGKPSIITAIYSGFTKNVLGFLCTCLIIGVATGVGGYLNQIFSHRVFNILGRITFSVYLIHSLVIRVTMCNMRNAVATNAFLLVNIMSTVCLSFVAGYLLCLLIEIPFSNIVKTLTRDKPNKNHTRVIHEEANLSLQLLQLNITG